MEGPKATHKLTNIHKFKYLCVKGIHLNGFDEAILMKNR